MKNMKRTLALLMAAALTLALAPLAFAAAPPVGAGNYYLADMNYTINKTVTIGGIDTELTSVTDKLVPAQNWLDLGICNADGSFKDGYYLQVDLYTDNADVMNAGVGQIEITSSGASDINEMHLDLKADVLDWQTDTWIRQQIPLTDFIQNDPSQTLDPTNVNLFRIYLNNGDSGNLQDFIGTTVKLQINNVRIVDSSKTKPSLTDDPVGVVPTVTDVSISPNPIDMANGGSQAFTATVTGTLDPPQTVTWSVSGNYSRNTSISTDGVLTIGDDETATTMMVKATSTFDTGKYARAYVTLSGNVMLGDVDDSGNVDTTDARLVLQYIVQKVDLADLNDTALIAADCNKDGKIDTTDARLILQYIVKKINKLG